MDSLRFRGLVDLASFSLSDAAPSRGEKTADNSYPFDDSIDKERVGRAAPTAPLVTIAIPTYNRLELVEKCVRSAMAQTYPNIEILVSDNASTDGTVEALKAIDDDRIRVLTSEENAGPIANFNKCIDMARGSYFVLAADDNYYRPDFVEKCVRLIESEPNLPIVLAAYDVLVVNEFSTNDRRTVPARLSKKFSTGIWLGTDVLQEYLHGRISAQLLSSLVRTDILRRNGGYSLHPCASDEATWIPFLLEGRVGLVDEPCATYMVLRESLTEGFTADKRLRDLREVLDELSVITDRKVSNPATRKRIQKLLNRYLAYMAAVNLVIYRRGGASLSQVAQKLSDWRPILAECSVADFLTTWRLRSIVRILSPQPLARWMARNGLDKWL